MSNSPFLVAVLILSLSAAANAASPNTAERKYSPPDGQRPDVHVQEAEAGGEDGDSPVSMHVPVRVYYAGTPDEPLILATIGDFPADLGKAGEAFLRREFFEQFIVRNVKTQGAETSPEPKVILHAQESDNTLEGDFYYGDVSGNISVLVTERRVFVMCEFTANEKNRGSLAETGRAGAKDSRQRV